MRLKRIGPALAAVVIVVLGLFTAGTAAALGSDDYPYGTAGIDQPDPWNFLTRECTSFVAWRLRNDLGVGDFTNGYRGGWFGNAENWAANARSIGLPVDGSPARGTVAVFPPGVDGAGGLGHVAVVLSVGNGTVTVEDYNYEDSWNGFQPYRYSQHTVNTSGLSFIHFGGTSGNVYHVTATAGLKEHTGPHTTDPTTTTLAHQAAITIRCQTSGELVKPGSDKGSVVWDRLADGGYVSDYYVDTPVVDDFSPNIPRC